MHTTFNIYKNKIKMILFVQSNLINIIIIYYFTNYSYIKLLLLFSIKERDY